MSQKTLEKQSLLSSWESDEKLNDVDVVDSARNIKQKEAQVLQFNTQNGTQQVTIHGDLSSKLPIILTYPDIGITHHGCFDPFFNMVTSYESIFEYFVIVHIDPPGNHYNAELKKKAGIESFDFESLSDDIYDLISKQLKIDWKTRALIAFGIGSSCSLWTKLANTHPSLLRGMVLINPIADVASWKEWAFDKALQWTEHNKTGEYVKSIFWGSLLPRYFPTLIDVETSEELRQSFYQEFAKLNEDNVMKYFKGYLRRKEITLQDLKNIK
ncbi:hypothetical protein RFI_06752 [Reticulomyxa filosa]|uniref:AB hydrolase-1 domain-containing protein n=1 Tax=Reticulomyxa filosa TaxID=46433 RepID=X6NWZ4_RETFI|nr:hypothetical protein RFI_06752 [Reticulomyxa filosa]|eukprot:ETO30368.1 hypothetical protein RFI_06752 [Reticulomyxa filosa]